MALVIGISILSLAERADGRAIRRMTATSQNPNVYNTLLSLKLSSSDKCSFVKFYEIGESYNVYMCIILIVVFYSFSHNSKIQFFKVQKRVYPPHNRYVRDNNKRRKNFF